MYCKYCGNQIDDNSKFCKFCGKKLVETQKVNIEFTKPIIIENILVYIKKQYEKYRLFFKLLMKDEMLIFYPLLAFIFIVWITFLTFAIIGGILTLLHISTSSIPDSYGIILVIIITIILFNWFVNYYVKHEQSKS